MREFLQNVVGGMVTDNWAGRDSCASAGIVVIERFVVN